MEDIRIYFIGDSYINGTGDPQYLGWPGRVCVASQSDQAGITCYNLGIRADTSEDILRRWESEVDARRLKPHDGRIVFGFGANDCWLEEGKMRIARAETEKNAEHILSRAVERLPTLMIGPPPGLGSEQDAMRQDMSALLQDICTRVGVPYLAVIDAGGSGGWRSDTSHHRRLCRTGQTGPRLADMVVSLGIARGKFRVPSNVFNYD